MSIAATAWAFAQQHVPATARYVLVAMAGYADHAGVCWPSLAALQVKTGLSERAVRRHLRTLEELGVLVVMAHRKGGRATTTRYALQLDKGAPMAPFEPETGPARPPKQHLNGASHAPIKRLKGATQSGKGASLAPESSRTKKEREERGGERARAPAPLPYDWTPSEAGKELARKLGLDVPRTLRMFCNHYLANGVARPDWQAQFQKWCDDECNFARTQAGGGRVETFSAYFAKQRALGRDADDPAELDEYGMPRQIGRGGDGPH